MKGFAQGPAAGKLQRLTPTHPHTPHTHTGKDPPFALGSSVGSPQVLWVLESSRHPILITPTLRPDSRSLPPPRPDPIPSSLCPTPSIWPPDGSLGLLTEPAALARADRAPQSSPPLPETGSWAEEEVNAGQASTMCQTRSQTPSLWFNILLTLKNTSLAECY